MASKRVLVVDCFPARFRKVLVDLGLPRMSAVEVQILEDLDRAIDCEILYLLEEQSALPDAATISAYDGLLWTGTPYSVTEDLPDVHRQLEMMSAAGETGVPMFGICGGIQVAAVAGGGAVESNPRGLESRVARKIRLTDEAGRHPMMRYRDVYFDAFCDHFDQVSALPAGGTLLAYNDVCAVQAAAFPVGNSDFWGVQYHPDFEISYLRALPGFRGEDWLAHGLVANRDEINLFRGAAARLEADIGDSAAAWVLGIDKDVLDQNLRRAEVRAWAEHHLFGI